ncbi:Cell wall beta-glucan synthesis [Penicillium cf. griseofulvum]|uniref:Cell wall beta-glucan synthesis n=1 Tax=Penicillium cf. griseofulvum TaxID=2972120 RepID=A0A9W9JQN1_9EURO|nr:Cell wall beta-glucan synthesis [Penicillium cf. griseofulvum]KAJ5423818.1 Cell wall beta-glucan synthesis [Penicillium cf. griseofulvum]
MRFFVTLAMAAMAAVASADSKANPFSIPTDGYTFKTGEATALTWKPTTHGTVSLILQWGAVMTGNSGTVIASSINNDGSYTWDVPSSLAAQPDYTIKIVSDDDSNDFNYIGRFTVEGSTVSVSSSSASSTKESTSTDSSTKESTSTDSSTKATRTTTSDESSTASSKPTSSPTMTTVSSTSASATPTESPESSSAAASTSAAQTTVPTANAAVANRVSGGLLALLAGALML